MTPPTCTDTVTGAPDVAPASGVITFVATPLSFVVVLIGFAVPSTCTLNLPLSR